MNTAERLAEIDENRKLETAVMARIKALGEHTHETDEASPPGHEAAQPLKMMTHTHDKHLLAIARTQIQLGFLALNAACSHADEEAAPLAHFPAEDRPKPASGGKTTAKKASK